METVKINFKGGIISPGILYNILVAATKHRLMYVSFGLRQQLLIDVPSYTLDAFTAELDSIGAVYSTDINKTPNIVSSFPATDVFMNYTWLKEDVYKSILGKFDYNPEIKINITETNQSFTPFITGNINWIASKEPNHWHLILRLPKSNEVLQWDKLVQSEDIAEVSKLIEEMITSQKPDESQEGILSVLDKVPNKYLTNATVPIVLPPFNLTYYEGFNKYGEGINWLGIYRRDELFSVRLLKDLCKLTLDSDIEYICATPWKSLIIKNIKDDNKQNWLSLLNQYGINLRHAANELNFQIEDHDLDALNLKKDIIQKFNEDDVRTYGLCIGIKTKKKSEIYSSILVRKKYLIDIAGLKLIPRYDILIAKDFNPNERTESVHISNIPRFLVTEHLKRAIRKFYIADGEHEVDSASENQENLF